MKKFTLTIILIMLFTLGFSQTNTPYSVTWESGTVAGTWTSFENGSGIGYERVANPVKGGINTSDYVAKFSAASKAEGSQPWAGCESNVETLGKWTIDASTTTISIMVYKTVISNVGVKWACVRPDVPPVGVNHGTIFELKKPNTKINEWELMTFDIPLSSIPGGIENIDNIYGADQLIVFSDWPISGNRTNASVTYFDNVNWVAKKMKEATDAPLRVTNFKTANISMYPNPVKNSLNIEAKSTIKKVSVYNVLGQEVLAKNPNSNATTLQTNNLAKGVYIVKASIDGKIATSKFIKE